jgi:hypothetical protein
MKGSTSAFNLKESREVGIEAIIDNPSSCYHIVQ